MNQVLTQAIKHWNYVAPLVAYPNSKKEFERLVARLDELLDIVGDDEHHPLMSLIDVVSHLIATYEEHHFEESKVMGVDALKLLMEQHELKQKDLNSIISQGVLSEVLSGKRKLNLRQIKKLADYFHVNPATFI